MKGDLVGAWFTTMADLDSPSNFFFNLEKLKNSLETILLEKVASLDVL